MQALGTCRGAAMGADSATSALFREHLDWAASVGRNVARGLPPSFDLDDLQQIAVIEHWRRVDLYDGASGVPYRAYAYLAIRGAVLMACRRKAYREATHDELPEEKRNRWGGEGGATPNVPRDN